MVECWLRMKFLIIIPFLFFTFLQAGTSVKNEFEINTLSSHSMSLEHRYENSFVSNIFKDNILLNMAYMKGLVKKEDDINWLEIQKPFEYSFRILPNQTFSFHDGVLDQFKDKIAVTANAHFNSQEGFKSDGYLFGDGVCHLASLIYWAAKDANLEAFAPTNHNFHQIPEIPREYGVAIYNALGAEESNAMQNLYITNNKENPVEFAFNYDGNDLKVSINEIQRSISAEPLTVSLLN